MDRILLIILLTVYAQVSADESIARALHITTVDKQLYLKQNIQLLGALRLDSITGDGQKLMELSGLAWDADEAELYALSDRGFFIRLRPSFANGELVDLIFLSSHALTDANGKPVKYKHADSEGLDLLNANNGISGDTRLIVSYERVPRVIEYDTDGAFIKQLTLTTTLSDIRQYSGENKSMEAITNHDKYGLLLGTERPLPANGSNIFNLNGDKQWLFEPNNERHGSLVGLTSLANGVVIALERSFPGIFAGVTTSLHMLTFADNSLQQQLLFSINPAMGLFNDNFEGITWHRGNRFFMISDDNDTTIQRNLLLYFSVPDLDKRLSNRSK